MLQKFPAKKIPGSLSATTEIGARSFSAPPPERTHFDQGIAPHDVQTLTIPSPHTADETKEGRLRKNVVGVNRLDHEGEFQIPPVTIIGPEEPIVLKEVGSSRDERTKERLKVDGRENSISR